jgi:hypothetical protein
VKTSIYQDKTWQTTTIRAGSIVLGHIFRDVLQTGIRSRSMRIPGLIMGASTRHHEQVLSGLLRGDGDVDVPTGHRTYRRYGHRYDHEFNTGQIGYFSSSPELLGQVDYLLMEQGLSPRIKKGKPHLRVAGREALSLLAPLFAGEKAERLQRLDAARVRPGPTRTIHAWSGGSLVPVVRVTPYPADEFVYSLEVTDTHTFATSGGLFVHNCIPIDPFYLTWAARSYGVHTRFIELAGEINTGMPHYVVERVAAALNDRGRALKGSKILVLGAAYKPDVDDCRESPAYELMELLQARGAIIAYNDPHVPVLPPLRGHSIRLESVPLSPETLAAQDCVLVATDHAFYDWETIARHARLLVDTRGATRRLPPEARGAIITA